MLDPGRGRTKTGCLWGYAIDDRPWGGHTPPAVVYLYAEDRKGEHPAAHLAEFTGILQVDGYSGFKGLLAGRPPRPDQLAFCWAHCRRRLLTLPVHGLALAEEALRRIGELYRPRPRSAAARPRSGVRSGGNAASRLSRPCMPGSIQLGRVSGRSTLAEAIRYALRHWQEFGPVPRGWPDRAGHERHRASHPADRPRQEERPLRRLGWWGSPLGDRGQPGGDRRSSTGWSPWRGSPTCSSGWSRGAPRRTSSRACCLGLGRPSSSRLSQLLDP